MGNGMGVYVTGANDVKISRTIIANNSAGARPNGAVNVTDAGTEAAEEASKMLAELALTESGSGE